MHCHSIRMNINEKNTIVYIGKIYLLLNINEITQQPQNK